MRELGIFLGKIVSNLLVFLALAAVAIVIQQALDYAQSRGVDTYVLAVLKLAEYAVATIDATLFVMWVARGGWHFFFGEEHD